MTENTVTELQAALRALEMLRTENADLHRLLGQRDGDVARADALALEHARDLTSAQQQHATDLQHHQAALDALYAQLREQQTAFDRLRATAVLPTDLDLLQVRMMEEMEAKWQHKCTALESLVDEANHHLGQSRTEYAALTARLEAVTLRHAEELKRQQETHAVTLQKAQTTQRQLTTDMEHLRAQQAGVEALRAQIVDLERGLAAAQEEAETTRAERGRVVAGLEGTILQLKRDVGRAEAEGLAHQHAARDTHEQVEGLKNELAGMARKYEAAVAKRAEDQATLGEATAKAQSEALGLEQRLLSKERTVADLRDTLTRVQNEGIVREKELSDRVDELERTLRSAHDKHERQLAQDVAAARTEATRRLGEVEKDRDAYQSRAELAESRETAAVKALRAAEGTWAVEKAERDARVVELIAKEEIAQRHVQESKREMESLRTRVETLTESQSDLHASHDALKRREADLEQQVRMGQEEKDRLRARIVGLESEVADVRAQWRKEQEGQVKRVENMTRSFDTEKKALGKQYEASLDKLHSTYRVKVHGARARLRAVKEALARCVEEKEMLSDRVVELESRVREMQVAGATLSWGAGDDGSDDGLTGSADRQIADIRSKIEMLRKRQNAYGGGEAVVT